MNAAVTHTENIVPILALSAGLVGVAVWSIRDAMRPRRQVQRAEATPATAEEAQRAA